jgi:prepilin-type N-terminal cleavage/methylation domain-containing protein
MKILNIKNKYGFALVEILVASSILSILSFSVISATNKGIGLSNSALNYAQASFLLEEGAEVVKILRDNNWSNISNLNLGVEYYVSFNLATSSWIINTTPNVVDGLYTRKIVFSGVNRDANDDISVSGTNDSGSRRVDVEVVWSGGGDIKTKVLSFYIFNIFN